MYVEFVSNDGDFIRSFSLPTVPRAGDWVEIEDGRYRVASIEWHEVDLGHDTKELKPLVKLVGALEKEGEKVKCKKCSKKQSNEDFCKSFSHTNPPPQTARPESFSQNLVERKGSFGELSGTGAPFGPAKTKTRKKYEVGQEWVCETGEIVEITGEDRSGFGRYYINHTRSYIDGFNNRIFSDALGRYRDIKLVTLKSS